MGPTHAAAAGAGSNEVTLRVAYRSRTAPRRFYTRSEVRWGSNIGVGSVCGACERVCKRCERGLRSGRKTSCDRRVPKPNAPFAHKVHKQENCPCTQEKRPNMSPRPNGVWWCRLCRERRVLGRHPCSHRRQSCGARERCCALRIRRETSPNASSNGQKCGGCKAPVSGACGTGAFWGAHSAPGAGAGTDATGALAFKRAMFGPRTRRVLHHLSLCKAVRMAGVPQNALCRVRKSGRRGGGDPGGFSSTPMTSPEQAKCDFP